MQQLVIKHLLIRSFFLKRFTLFFILSLAHLSVPVMASAQDFSTPQPSQTDTITTVRQTISPEKQKELTYIVQQDCGSCHGMTLKGGLGPSLLPERISVLPKDYLIDAITHGRHGTPMPPWGSLLTKNEIIWIVEQLQLGQLAHKNTK